MTITLNTLDKVFKAKQSTAETMELKGFEFVKRFFVDSSGFGADYEPALTPEQFKQELSELLQVHGKLTAKLIGVGQFQVYVGLFKRVKRGAVKQISPSLFERVEDGKTIVRLYDTDIVSIDGYMNATINNGGFQTVTTKKWINEYISPRFYVFQRKFEWFIHDMQENKDIPYIDNMVLPL